MHLKRLLFQYLFYTGSWVSKDRYAPFLTKLQERTGMSVNFRSLFHNPLESPTVSNNTILVGHSFGGYFALRDAIKFPDKVAGVVLINSHFNDRCTMPYFRIGLKDVEQPVLTLLGGKDDRLPIQKSLDDLWCTIQYREPLKYFSVNPNAGHFSGVADHDEDAMEKLLRPISVFAEATKQRNFSRIRNMTEHLVHKFEPMIEHLSKNIVMTSRSSNVIDAIFNIVLPQWIWQFGHFMWFLNTTPDKFLNYMFEDDDHVFWKGNTEDEERITALVEQWMRLQSYDFLDIRLPTIHPSILMWVYAPLLAFRWGKDNTVFIPRMILPVNHNTTYYKIPHPRKLYALLDRENLLAGVA